MGTKKEVLKGALDKIKLVDAGVKNKYDSLPSPVKASSYEDKISYPCLYLSADEAPMLIGCDVGCEVTLLVKTKITSHSVDENSDRKRENFNLEIHKIGVVDTIDTDDTDNKNN